MPIQYAGVDLLLEDPGGETRKWIDRFLSTAGMRIFTVPVELSEAGNTAFDIGSSAPIPNYPPWPQPKINSLYWPTGGLRWGHGFFLADDTGYQAILDALDVLGNRGSPALLKFFDSDVNPSSISGVWMYLLPARPISAYDGEGGNPLWLLPLVDQRYWWQFRPWSGSSATWSVLFNDLQTTLGLQDGWVDTPAPAYSAPSGVVFNQLGGVLGNSGVIVDAAAVSTGMRFVLDVDFTGSVQNGYIERNDTAETILDANIAKGKTAGVIAGGEFSTDGVPVGMAANVNVGFQIATQRGYGASFTIGTGGDVDGTTKLEIIRVSTNSFSGNLAWETALATQLKDDYAGWSSRLYDFTFAGIVDWRPCGFDDYIEWFIGRRTADGKYQMHTRVRSMPHNFGAKTVAVARVGTDLDVAGTGMGCCAGCIDKKYLTVHVGTEDFMQEYYATNIPARWGADSSGRIILSYIGVTSGISGIVDGSPYWQSPTFTITCGAGSDTYFWRMFYSGVLNGSLDCNGTQGPYLYPVRVGSTSVCGDLTATLCDNTTLVYLFSGSVGGWRPRCGRSLEYVGTNYVTSAVDDYAPCAVCVYPKIDLPPAPSSVCLDTLRNRIGRVDPWPSLLIVDISCPGIPELTRSYGMWSGINGGGATVSFCNSSNQFLSFEWVTVDHGVTVPDGQDISVAFALPSSLGFGGDPSSGGVIGDAWVGCSIVIGGSGYNGLSFSTWLCGSSTDSHNVTYQYGVHGSGIPETAQIPIIDWNNINGSVIFNLVIPNSSGGSDSFPVTFTIHE